MRLPQWSDPYARSCSVHSRPLSTRGSLKWREVRFGSSTLTPWTPGQGKVTAHYLARYSQRRATSGSTFAALRAGTRQANAATIASTPITTAIVFQSAGSTLNRTLFKTGAARTGGKPRRDPNGNQKQALL